MQNNILGEMLEKQRKDISTGRKLFFLDLKRLTKHLKKSIFDSECCIYNGSGYFPSLCFIPFYVGNQKFILHRLLYENFVGPLSESEYIKFNCENKGRCCNVNHLKKVKPKGPKPSKQLNKISNQSNRKIFKEHIIVDFEF